MFASSKLSLGICGVFWRRSSLVMFLRWVAWIYPIPFPMHKSYSFMLTFIGCHKLWKRDTFMQMNLFLFGWFTKIAVWLQIMKHVAWSKFCLEIHIYVWEISSFFSLVLLKQIMRAAMQELWKESVMVVFEECVEYLSFGHKKNQTIWQIYFFPK